MRNSALQKTIAAVALAAAVVMVAVGAMVKYKVYDKTDPDFAEFGLQTFSRVSGYGLVVDATFTGTERVEDKLLSTYDRSAPRGKRACPT